MKLFTCLPLDVVTRTRTAPPGAAGLAPVVGGLVTLVGNSTDVELVTPVVVRLVTSTAGELITPRVVVRGKQGVWITSISLSPSVNTPATLVSTCIIAKFNTCNYTQNWVS